MRTFSRILTAVVLATAAVAVAPSAYAYNQGANDTAGEAQPAAEEPVYVAPTRRVPPVADRPNYMSLSGPRMGVSFLNGRSYKALQARVGESAYPIVTVIGWQFEHAWMASKSGTAGLVEIVPTIAGFNQGVFAPGLNLVMGIRSASGIEGGMGVQASISDERMPLSVGALFAGGATVRTEGLNFPIHLVWVMSQESQRVGIVVGFSLAN
ncbi:MAG: hypothetical protein EXR79_17330 [Myxococcales bacterium]|nr:hypothetical protein [Myxococcales bacterium]